MPTDVSTLLTSQLEQLHEHARSELQLYVGWFTFFITVLMTAMSWAVKTSLDEQRRVRFPEAVYLIYGLFSFQIVLGGIATVYVSRDLANANSRIEKIQTLLVGASGAARDPWLIASTLPAGLVSCVSLMGITLWSNLLFWGIVTTVVAVKASRHRRSG
jgi:hypothetical protein